MGYKNNFLVSLPIITGGSFNKSVVYVADHNGDGAKGWIVNKQLEDSVAEKLRKGMNLQFKAPIYYGGPVEVSSAYVIHSKDFQLPGTIDLNHKLSMTRDKAVINIMNIGQFPEYWRIIVGSSSWGPGQLESEIYGSVTNGVGCWTALPYNNKLMWGTYPEEQWDSGIRLSAENLTSTVLNF